jgi:signal transduction histidine kinase
MKPALGKILLIEDTLSTIKMVNDTLQEAGHQVYVANTGEKGIARAEKVNPDLIILDIMMPGIDGYETCTRLKQIPALADIPVIFSSALRESIDKVKAFKLGAIDYIPKPIEPAELIERVNTHLSLYRLRHKLEHEVASRTEQLKKQNDELKIAWRQAEESNRAKEEFLSVLTHELKTPLNPIVTFSSLLLSEITEPEHIEMLHSVNSAAQQMNNLVADLLLFASKEASEPELSMQKFDLHEFLHNSVAYFHMLAQEKSFAFELDISPKVPSHIFSDKFRLRQILENLLNNAFKFCDVGTVKLSCYIPDDTPQQLVLCVSDTGIGIPKEKQALIFQPFYKVDASMIRKHTGVGLGLSIVQRIAEKLNARLRIESEEDKGTRAYLYLTMGSEI